MKRNKNKRDKFSCTHEFTEPKPIRLWARLADHACAEDSHYAQENGITPLHVAAFHGNIEKVKKLLQDKPTHLNATDSYGWTPLHDAVINGHTEIVKLLLAAGAQVNMQDIEEAYTPLHEAARMNHKAIVQALLAAGADPSIRDAGNQTALDIAQDHEFQDIVDILKAVS